MTPPPHQRITLGQVVGHERVIETLRHANASGTVHHAMLFAGPDGVGKRLIARAFAALVNCTSDDPNRSEACGVCKSCRRILDAGSAGPDAPRGPGSAGHPDVIEIEPDGRKIKIAQVRDLIRIVAFPPIEARVRVVILDPADALGEEAANALLKTLEEPSSHTRFILVSSAPDALLVTIRSRCQRVLFGRLDQDALARLLIDRFDVPEDKATAIAGVADGSAGHALALLEDPVISQRVELLRRLVTIAPGDALACFSLAADLYDLRGAVNTVLDIFSRLYRDVLLVRTGALRLEQIALGELSAEVDALTHRYGARSLIARLELIEDTRHGIVGRNISPRLSFERLVWALTAPAGREGVMLSIRALTAAGR